MKYFLHLNLNHCTCAKRPCLGVPLTWQPTALDANKHSARDGLQFYKRNRNFIIADVLLSCSPSQEEIREGENKYFIADMPITHTEEVYRRRYFLILSFTIILLFAILIKLLFTQTQKQDSIHNSQMTLIHFIFLTLWNKMIENISVLKI